MIPSTVRIFVCTSPQDMRRSFDGLALAVRERMGEDPESGAVFAFVNKRANRVKVMWFDRNGYCILYKRVHRAVFRVPLSTDAERPVAVVDAVALARLLRGIDKSPVVRNTWR